MRQKGKTLQQNNQTIHRAQGSVKTFPYCAGCATSGYAETVIVNDAEDATKFVATYENGVITDERDA